MLLTLKNFHITEDVVATAKGLKYYKKGAVSYLEELSEGAWESSVMGSTLYSVAVHLMKSKINAIGCDCPAFAKNDYCKHIAAVLFAIRDQTVKDKGKPTEKKLKPKTTAQILHEVIDTVESKNLKEFIESYASQHKGFANDVLLYFKLQSVIKETSEEGFIEIVKAAIETSRIKSDIDTDLLDRNLKPVMAQAMKYINDNNYLEAFYVAKAVIEVLTPLLNTLSYSFRYYANALTQSLDLLRSIAGFTIPPMFRDEIFDYCLLLSRLPELIETGYDRRIDAVLTRLANDTGRKEKILHLIDEKMGRLMVRGTLPTEHAQALHLGYANDRIALLTEMGREKDAWKIVTANIPYHDSLRDMTIRKALENKDTGYARQLITEKLSTIDKIGSGWQRERETAKWQPYYIDIAILENDVPAILSNAESLFKGTQDINYYDILKKHFPTDKWQKKFEEIELSLFRKHYSFGTLATIYIREDKIKDLFELLKKHSYLGNIRDTLPILLPLYGTEVLALYNKALTSLLQEATVKAYKETCDQLRYVISLGQKETAQYWIESFKSVYSNRPRLLKELAKIKL